MPTIHEALQAKIAAVAGHARVYYSRLPQRPTYPAISYWRVTGATYPSLSAGPAELQRADVQIDVWDDDYDGAQQAAETLRQGLERYVGMLGPYRASITDWSSRDQYHDDAQPPAVHQVICLCSVWFGEP